MIRRPAALLVGLVLVGVGVDGPPSAVEVVLPAAGPTEAAPHGGGNVYGPSLLIEAGRWRMWYGGQGRDGHDRIHLAESADGVAWERRGVVLDVDAGENHVNDPSVVRVGGVYHLYYTRAMGGVVDSIALATSPDGVRWTKRGVVLRPGTAGSWDSLLVGRPSVVHEDGVFRMWYDGRQDLPPGPLAQGVPTSPNSHRGVGLATSPDGLVWTKNEANPVFGGDAGGVDVARVGKGYAMLRESAAGVQLATSRDGFVWRDRGLIVPRSGGPIDRAGHVTPAFAAGERWIYLGAASAPSWDHNAIARVAWPTILDRGD